MNLSGLSRKLTPWRKTLKGTGQEFPVWPNRIGGISGALGCRFDSPAQRSGSGVVAVAVAQVAIVAQI